MDGGSVSKSQVILEIIGKSKIKCELKRHLSPKTVGKIMRSLPIQGNAHFLGKSIVYFETSIDSGIERSRKEFKKGDIAFLPIGKLICFFHSDVKVGKEMTSIGKMIDNIDDLSTVTSGTELKFYCDAGT